MAAPLDDQGRAILDAATRLLAREGPAALTVRRVATDAGGSTMNVYSRFGGKQGLIDALFIAGFEQLTGELSQVDATADPTRDVVRCCAAYRAFAITHRPTYTLMFERSELRTSPEAVQASARALEELHRRVALACNSGGLRGDPLHLTAGFWATSHGLVTLELAGLGPPEIEWPKRFDQTIEALLRGYSS